jgi:hypothetical protein
MWWSYWQKYGWSLIDRKHHIGHLYFDLAKIPNLVPANESDLKVFINRGVKLHSSARSMGSVLLAESVIQRLICKWSQS